MSGTRTLALVTGLLAALGVATPPPASAVPWSAAGLSASTDGTPSARAQDPADPPLMKLGETVYAQSCSKCHQTNGRGVPGAFPPLAGNANLRKLELVVTTVESGHSGRITVKGQRYDETMPPMGQGLSDRRIAAVATFVRNSWGNAFGAVTEKEVKDIVSKEKPPGQ
jgi:cytochrome c oxidase subunit 2